MINLYDLSKASDLLKLKKKWFNILLVLAILVLAIISVLTIFFDSLFVMILDMVLAFLYISLLYTYIKLIKKTINEEYHMLAKIQHYDHEIIQGKIEKIDENLTTIATFETSHMIINNRSFYVDINKLNVLDTFKVEQTIKAELVDNMLVAFEVINNDF